MQQYDIAAKVLIDACRDDIIRYLLDLPVHQSRLMEPLPQETASLKRGDYPVLVTDHEGREQLIVLEIQTEWNRTVPLHLLDYRIRYLIKHDVEALTCVLLLRPSGSATDLYEDREVRFRYRLVRIYEMDARAVVSEGPICMLPFVPLLKGGADCFDQAEAIIYGSERGKTGEGGYAHLNGHFFRFDFCGNSRTAHCKEKGYYDGIRCLRYYKTRRHHRGQKRNSQKSAAVGRFD